MPAQLPTFSSSGLITGYNEAPNLNPANRGKKIGSYTWWDGTNYRDTSGKVVKSPQESDAATSQTQTESPDAGNPNNDFKLLSTVKNPAISAATDAALKQVQDSNAQAQKTFADYLNEAKEQQASNKIQLQTDRNNLDVAPLESELRRNNADYATQARTTNQRYLDANADYKKQQQDVIARLAEEDARYEEKARAVADQALRYAGARLDRYQAGSGTPSSGGSDMRDRAIQTFADINTPLQKELAATRMGQLTNFIAPTNRDIYGTGINQIGYETAMQGNIADRNSNTAVLVQNLKTQLAGRSLDESIRYMQSVGVPLEIAQQVVGRSLTNLQGVTGLDQANTFYGLSQLYQPFVNGLPNYGASGGGGYGSGRYGTFAAPLNLSNTSTGGFAPSPNATVGNQTLNPTTGQPWPAPGGSIYHPGGMTTGPGYFTADPNYNRVPTLTASDTTPITRPALPNYNPVQIADTPVGYGGATGDW